MGWGRWGRVPGRTKGPIFKSPIQTLHIPKNHTYIQRKTIQSALCMNACAFRCVNYIYKYIDINKRDRPLAGRRPSKKKRSPRPPPKQPRAPLRPSKNKIQYNKVIIKETYRGRRRVALLYCRAAVKLLGWEMEICGFVWWPRGQNELVISPTVNPPIQTNQTPYKYNPNPSIITTMTRINHFNQSNNQFHKRGVHLLRDVGGRLSGSFGALGCPAPSKPTPKAPK